MSDTIAAVSTPMAPGSIGVIRISGDNAKAVADRVFTSKSGKKVSSLKGYTALFGCALDQNGEKIDEAVVLNFNKPYSYTGEDVVEIQVHSGPYILKKVLESVISSGARLAEPGEFTKVAFLNGKLDLIEAESVMGLIGAENADQLKVSNAAKEGRVSKEISEITDLLLKVASAVAVYSDFPDEELEGVNKDAFLKDLEETKERLCRLVASYDEGKIIREGVNTAIVGKPNVGKSTLMNGLLGFERSIVTDIAGTTRDIVEDRVNVDGIILNISDTAGIHETFDTVEVVGVKKATEKLYTAQLVLAVFDASNLLTKEDLKIIKTLNKGNTIAVINKTDMGEKIDVSPLGDIKKIYVCAKTGGGIDELKMAIKEILNLGKISENSAVLMSLRQKNDAQNALNAVKEAITALDGGMTVDAVGVLVDDAVYNLLRLTGKRVTDSVADEVFKRFCVGK